MTVWFDVEDLFYYVQTGHRRTSGIQRLALEIYRGAVELGGAEVRFVRHAPAPDLFAPVEWPAITAQFAPQEVAQVEPAAAPGRSRAELVAAGLTGRLPDEVRKPLVLAAAAQLQAFAHLARFGVNLAVHSPASLIRRALRATAGARQAPAPAPAPFAPRPGDTLLVLGSPWFRRDYGNVARALRDDRRMRFGLLMHDLVPIRRPEWVDSGNARIFEEWYSDVLPFCDAIFANSRHTAADIEAYLREHGLAPARPVQALPIGTGFGLPDENGAPPPPGLPEPGSYVLYVSTMEARKNHALAVQVWSALLEQVRTGQRDPATVPDLVFAGRVGWLVDDLIQQLENTDWLGGRVRMVHNPTDAGLRALYQGCMFTFFPSFHEGWGLPVTESLALGKPCLASNTAALPESGGTLCRYFDPENLPDAVRAVAAVLDDRPGLAAWENEVRRAFEPIPWSRTARVLLDAVTSL